MEKTSVETAFDNFDVAEQKEAAVWKPEDAIEDPFQKEIKDTAKTLLSGIAVASKAKFVEPADLAKMTKAVCELQNTFFGKEDKGGALIMTNQLSLFKGML